MKERHTNRLKKLYEEIGNLINDIENPVEVPFVVTESEPKIDIMSVLTGSGIIPKPGFTHRENISSRLTWSDTEEKIIRDAIEEGINTIDEIAGKLSFYGRSLSAVRSRVIKMGYAIKFNKPVIRKEN